MRSQRRTIDETQARPSFEAAGIAAIELCNEIDVSINDLGRVIGEDEDVWEASQLSNIIVTSRVAHRSRLIESTIEFVVDDDIEILSDGSLFSD
jgi:hypothetical protein